jgi:hypothetical protein
MTLILFEVSVSVKITEYPHSSKHYTLPSNTLSIEMFQFLYMKIREDFRLEPDHYHISLFETITQPQCEAIENVNIRNQFQLRVNRKQSILLYIIKKPREEEPESCPICYVENSSSNRILTTLYYCGHPICQQCHILCIDHNRRQCSLCRSAERFHDSTIR